MYSKKSMRRPTLAAGCAGSGTFGIVEGIVAAIGACNGCGPQLACQPLVLGLNYLFLVLLVCLLPWVAFLLIGFDKLHHHFSRSDYIAGCLRWLVMILNRRDLDEIFCNSCLKSGLQVFQSITSTVNGRSDSSKSSSIWHEYSRECLA